MRFVKEACYSDNPLEKLLWKGFRFARRQ